MLKVAVMVQGFCIFARLDMELPNVATAPRSTVVPSGDAMVTPCSVAGAVGVMVTVWIALPHITDWDAGMMVPVAVLPTGVLTGGLLFTVNTGVKRNATVLPVEVIGPN